MVLLRDIRMRLRAGIHPCEFGQLIGDGCQRQAYLVGDFVVKRHAGAYRLDSDCECPYPNIVPVIPCERFFVPRMRFARIGLCPPEQWFVRSKMIWWEIQPYYRPLTQDEEKLWCWLNRTSVYMVTPFTRKRIRLDLHTANMGVHLQRGTFHAIDW